MSKEEMFLWEVTKRLPEDLEIHKWDGCYGTHYEIRPRGCWFNFWRPAISINEYRKNFRIRMLRDIPLAKRLVRIFPEITFESSNPKICKLLVGGLK